MNRILLIIFLILTPLVSFSRITFAGAVLPYNHRIYSWKNHCKIRRALLNANGKDWFMKHLIYRKPDSLSIYIKFYEGDYLAAGVMMKGLNHTRPRVSREFFDGLKKAVDLMSQNNDTLLYTAFVNPEYFLQTIRYINHYYLLDEPDSINYDGMVYSAQPKRRFAIAEFRTFSYASCLRTAFQTVFGELPEELKEYVYPINYPDCRFYEEKYIPVTSAEVAEKLYELVNRFDDYILSLPSTNALQYIFLPYDYTPHQHDSDNDSR